MALCVDASYDHGLVIDEHVEEPVGELRQKDPPRAPVENRVPLRGCLQCGDSDIHGVAERCPKTWARRFILICVCDV